MTPADLEAALYDPDPVKRDEARARVAREADAAALRTLVNLTDARQRQTRRRAARILSEVDPDKARPVLLETMFDAEATPRVRGAVTRIASVLFPAEDEALGRALRSEELRVRRHAATARAPVAALEVALLDDAIEVAERAAAALEVLDHAPSGRLLEDALAKHADAPALLRLRARSAPDHPALIAAAKAGDPTALDHLAHAETLVELLDGPARVAAAWGLAKLGCAPEAFVADPDARVRQAAAKAGLTPASLVDDADPGVRWLARRRREGAYAPGHVAARLAPHARADAPSARPPYGLRPEDELPDVERAHAALALCHTRFDVNLGVAVRSAEAAGLREIYLVGRDDLFRSPARGTDLLLPIQGVADGAALARRARENGYQIVAVQQTPDSVPYHTADYPPRPLFVMGAEDEGVPADLLRAADLVVEIPMFGVIDSLNVAAAATTVMFQWRVRRADA